MSLRNTITTYGSVAKFFHWIIFLLLACMLTFGYFMGDMPKPYKPMVYNIHKLTGLTILVLMILRLLWAFTNPKPIVSVETPAWQRLAERLVQGLIYLSVIAMPIVGWVGATLGGSPPHIGSFKLPLPLNPNDNLSDTAFSVHNTLAIIIIVLISIHALAALYHYFIKKDDILQRMLPGS